MIHIRHNGKGVAKIAPKKEKGRHETIGEGYTRISNRILDKHQAEWCLKNGVINDGLMSFER